MNLSKASITAVHGIIYLANRAGQSPTDIKFIAQELQIPQGYLAKIFQRLARTHLVYSQRGPQGGYVLAREPAKITLVDIVEAIDGPMLTGQCELRPGNHCPHFEGCAIRARLDSLKERTREMYQDITLDMFENQFTKV